MRDDIIATFTNSVASAQSSDTPYRHWFLEDCVAGKVVDEIAGLPMEAPALEGVSGKRELHNNTRTYFDAENQARFPVVKAVCEAFQDRGTVRLIEESFGTDVVGGYLRIEYAQDTDGFWLEPHTDLGVKLFTMLIYLSRDASHHDLGTDVYDAEGNHVARSPFKPGGAMIFVPSDITYHGFQARPIKGVRKSVIINYVTDEWRAREQLAYPDAPIS